MRALNVLFLIVLVVAIVGWWRGWYVIDSFAPGEPTKARITIDHAKLAAVAGDAATGIGQLTARAAAAFRPRLRSESSFRGELEGKATLVHVNQAARSVELRVGDEVFTMAIDEDTDVFVADRPASLGQLRSGETVTLRLNPNNGGRGFRIVHITQ
jgi:hypothetical protein